MSQQEAPPVPDEPIVIPRPALITMYAGFVVLGSVAAIAGIPTLDASTPDNLITPYALAITLCAIAAVIGASSKRREPIEMAGALLLFILLTAYAAAAAQHFVSGDLRRGSFSIVLVMITLAPAARGLSLLRRLIRRRLARKARNA